jgi:hypothetical protein
LLFSVLIFGTESFPAWRMTQPARDESNSFVNSLGSGVAEGSRVGVGGGVPVAGIRVGGGVAVGKSGATGVELAGWQAVVKIRHPIRMRKDFFMALL